jgi:methyl halide transferase
MPRVRCGIAGAPPATASPPRTRPRVKARAEFDETQFSAIVSCRRIIGRIRTGPQGTKHAFVVRGILSHSAGVSSPTYRHIGRRRHPLDAAFWQRCYVNGDAFWDHGEPSPGLVDFLRKNRRAPGQTLVPGCGFGHDCLEFARHGFKVTGLDISPRAVVKAAKLAQSRGIRATYRHGDFLNLATRYRSRFDWVFEHTCFCAIDPAQRDRYVIAAVRALRQGGYLLGIFYNIQPKSGPPFGTTREELLERFRPHFRLISSTVPRSYPNRTGKELLMLWRKK